MRVLLKPLGLLLAVALAAVAAYWWARGGGESRPSLDFVNLAGGVAYVGDGACRTCHQSIFDSYARTGMARSWATVSPANLPSSDRDWNEVEDATRNFRYRAFVEDGQLFQEEYRLDEQGRKAHSLIQPARHVIGSGVHGYSYVAEHNGYLTVLPLGWYTAASKWDLNPGYRQQNLRFSRPVQLECISCHASYPKFVRGSQNRYESPPEAIGCERCHGPGAVHVDQRNRLASAAGGGQADRTIVNPRRLPVTLQDDVCLDCHLIADVAFPAGAGDWTDFRPGRSLAEFRHDLFRQPEDPAKFGFSSHGPRMRLSRCWTDAPTRGQLTCITCHDPHQPLEEVPVRRYVETCLRCHAADDCRRDRGGEPARPAANCVECHMRKGNPSNVGHTVFTDHWIRARPEPLADSGPDNNAGRGGTRPLTLIDFWDMTTPPAKPVLAVGLARFAAAGGTARHEEVLAAIDAAVAEQPADAALQFWRGVVLEKLGRWSDAVAAYRRAAERRTDPLVGYSLGDAQRYAGSVHEAIETFRATIARDPDFLPTHVALAEAHSSLGRFDEAMAVLDGTLARFPHQADAQAARARVGYLAGEPRAAVLEHIERARRLEPDSASVLWLLAECRSDAGDVAGAIEACEAAVAADPRFVPALAKLAVLLAKAGRHDECRQRIGQLRTVAPNHPAIEEAQLELKRAPPEPRAGAAELRWGRWRWCWRGRGGSAGGSGRAGTSMLVPLAAAASWWVTASGTDGTGVWGDDSGM